MHIGGLMVFDPLPDGGTPSLERLSSTISSYLGETASRIQSVRKK